MAGERLILYQCMPQSLSCPLKETRKEQDDWPECGRRKVRILKCGVTDPTRLVQNNSIFQARDTPSVSFPVLEVPNLPTYHFHSRRQKFLIGNSSRHMITHGHGKDRLKLMKRKNNPSFQWPRLRRYPLEQKMS